MCSLSNLSAGNQPTFDDFGVRVMTAHGWPLGDDVYRVDDLPLLYRAPLRVFAYGWRVGALRRVSQALLPRATGLFERGAVRVARQRGVVGAAAGRLCYPAMMKGAVR